MTGLDGRWVVVTRAAQQSGELTQAIADAGGAVVPLPLLEIQPAPQGGRAIAGPVERLGTEGWLAVLSPNGARSVVSAIPEPPGCKVAAVAAATAAPLVEAGWSVDLIADEPTAGGLAHALGSASRPGAAVIVQAAQGRPTLADELRRTGWDVDVVVGYENTVPEVSADAVTSARRADVVVFASPSAVERYVDHVGLEPALAACIGPVTEEAARAAGFATITAAQPTTEALVAVLVQALR